MKNILYYASNEDEKKNLSALYDKALADGEKVIYIPAGEYTIYKPIMLKSDMSIISDGEAYITAADGCFRKEDSFLICGYNVKNVNVVGGHWNGNIKGNPRDNFKTGAQTGVSFDFAVAENVVISDLTMTDSGSYHIRLGETNGFRVENIVFDDKNYYWCQDGVHLGGFCENGVIRNIVGKGRSTNDDFIALNADDVFWYSQSRGLKPGYIRNVLIENLSGDLVYTGVRILSTESEISDITIRNIRMGIRYYFLNLDGARYAADGVYPVGEYPEVCGKLKNITVENAEIWKVNETKYPLIVFETRAENFKLRNFKRLADTGDGAHVVTGRFRNIPTCKVTIDGKEMPKEFETDVNEISEMTVNCEPW